MIKLWNQTMPHRCVEDAFEPYLTPYDCDAAKTAIVVCPGGAYCGRADYEGNDVGAWLNTIGITAFVLEYRVAPSKAPAQPSDAQRAMRLARKLCMERGIERLGIMGFSAGGHLAAIAYIGYFRFGKELPPEFVGRQPAELAEKSVAGIRFHARWLAELVRMELAGCRERRPPGGKKRSDAYYLEQCERFIDRSYHQEPALADLAEILRVNPNHLGSAIRRASNGRSFRELLTERRIREAKLLFSLEPSRHTVAGVGRRCGFSDSNYFSTVFRKHTGCSPREFLRRISGGGVT